MATGIFPDSLKAARVVPIPKGGDAGDVGNYRPISVLPIFSKIFEKAMYLQLYSYLSSKSILSDNQFGFREGRSTVNAVSDLLRYVYGELDSDKYVISVMIDFRKTFDCFNHDILLAKLHYGVRGICHDWFRSYLSNRTQYVSVNGVISETKSVTCGVPQGSILGPLLFLIFINDITLCTPKFKFTLYADDCTLSHSFNRGDASIVSGYIDDGLNDVLKWVTCNKLQINVSKTEYLFFSYMGDVDLGDIRMSDVTLNKLNYIKFLGINIDSHLKAF